MRSLLVEDPGPLTLVEDLGRPGCASVGVPPSGALDPGALRLANRLVGNDESAAGLETTSGGLALRARGAVVVAAAGAPVGLVVDGPAGRRTHGPGAPVHVPDGALLRVLPPRHGLRAWLAVRGGLAVPHVLGSASTDLLSGLGAPLAAGQELPVADAPPRPVPPVGTAPLPGPPAAVAVLRAVLGPREDWFSPHALAALPGPWTVDDRADRVGVRLRGPVLPRAAVRVDAELPSEGAVAGAVQVSTSGVPVLFLRDHPVTGGYPVVATVVADDLVLAAQLAPGARLRLRLVGGPRLPHTRVP